MAPVKAVLFDYMGTCLNWHSTIIQTLPSTLSDQEKSNFALEWRQAYFDYNSSRLQQGQEVEDFDLTMRRVLDSYLNTHPDLQPAITPDVKSRLIPAWHAQKAWPDVSEALRELKEDRGLEVYVHANGSTRLQLDITKSAGLQRHFDMLFSSELLGVYKPAAESYLKVLDLLKLKAEECVLVAAHAYDLRGAKAVGMKTVYVYRWTDDILEDQEIIKGENDAYLEDMTELGDVLAGL